MFWSNSSNFNLNLKRFFCIGACLGLLTVTSCMVQHPPEFYPKDHVSSAPNKSWIPSDKRMSGQPLDRQLPKEEPPLENYTGQKSLSELIDIALRNNPKTRLAWAEAYASSATWAEARGEFYPAIDGSVSAGYQKVPPSILGHSPYENAQINLGYLLLDFGGRGARAEAARQALVASNWNQNQVIQDTFRDVYQAYYTHLGDLSQIVAESKNLNEAMASLAAARVKKEVGVNTLADVLQAKANADQVRVNLIKAKGDAEISAGNLATAIGWTADTPVQVNSEPEHIPLNEINNNVETLISDARNKRPQLNSAIAYLKQKEAELIKAKSAMLPTLNADGNYTWQKQNRLDETTYQAGLSVQFPIFQGFALRNAVRKAKADVEAARQQLRDTEDGIISEVWNAYHNYKTSEQEVKANMTLLASSRESFNVSLGRYKAGAADIVELLNAQSQLANARSELVNARVNYYNSFAELIHSVGKEMSPYGLVKDTRSHFSKRR